VHCSAAQQTHTDTMAGGVPEGGVSVGDLEAWSIKRKPERVKLTSQASIRALLCLRGEPRHSMAAGRDFCSFEAGESRRRDVN
jgi:hypothetical protein